MKITKEILDNLTSQAKLNPRLRQSLDMRTTPCDNSQRMVNALEPGTIIPIHRHRSTSETMIVLKGKLIERFYDNYGNIIDEFTMEPFGKYPMVQIEAGQWHSLEVLKSGTVIFEAKDGVYEQISSCDILAI